MLKSPFLLALLICSLIGNVSLFLSPYHWENDKYPPGENGSNQSGDEQQKPDTGENSSSIQIECDPNCAAKKRQDSRDNPGILKRYLIKTTEDPVAGFTGLLFVATVILAMIAGNQVRDSRAGQRAHVFVLSPRFEFQVHDSQIVGLRLWVVWKNSGQTPASPITALVAATWAPSVDQFVFGEVRQEGLRQPFVLGPGAEIASGTIGISPEHLLANLNRQGRQFFWGWARYQDIFPSSPEHVIEFCFEVTIDGQLGPQPFEGRVNFAFFGEHNRYYDA